MKAYWDTAHHSYIIENENGKRMRITSGMVEGNETSDYVVMTDAILVHEVSALDMVSIGDRVRPRDVAEEGVVLKLIGADCLMIYCGGQWRLTSGERVQFTVHEAVLRSKKSESLLAQVKTRLTEW